MIVVDRDCLHQRRVVTHIQTSLVMSQYLTPDCHQNIDLSSTVNMASLVPLLRTHTICIHIANPEDSFVSC